MKDSYRNSESSNDNFNFRQELLKISKADLQACRILFSKKYYCQSIFYLQQSLEKVTKYLFLDKKHFGEIKLQKEHDSLKIYKKAIQNLLKQYSGESALINPLVLKNKRDSVDEKDSLIEQIKFIDDLKSFNLQEPTTELALFINESLIDILKSTTFDNPLENISYDEMMKLMSDTGHLTQEEYSILIKAKQNPLLREMIDNGYKSISKELPNFMQGVMIIFYLNILFSTHAVISRYPNDDNQHSPINFYNEDNILIQSFDLYSDCAVHAIEKIEEFYK